MEATYTLYVVRDKVPREFLGLELPRILFPEIEYLIIRESPDGSLEGNRFNTLAELVEPLSRVATQDEILPDDVVEERLPRGYEKDTVCLLSIEERNRLRSRLIIEGYRHSRNGSEP